MVIKLYSTRCPKCNVLEKKLNSLGIDFEIITDDARILAVAEKANLQSAPILEVDNKYYDFSKANTIINKLGGK